MPQTVVTNPVTGFRGLDELWVPDGDPRWTSSLNNVEARFGRIFGRKGINEWDGITTSSGTTIHGLFTLYLSDTQTAQIVRLLPAAVEYWNSGGSTWDDITGTALTGAGTERPQFCNHPISGDFTLLFTNEGTDPVQKYTGSGTCAALGGSPPLCKAIESYVGFVMLGHTSDDSGATWSPLNIIYSDDPDNDWSLCAGNTLTIDESPGDIRVLRVLGRSMLVYKSDAVVRVTFVGGLIRFEQQKLPFDKGVQAPLTVQKAGEAGHIFLGTDMELYQTDGLQVRPLPSNVQRTLQDTITFSQADQCFAVLDPHKEVYHLFYPQSGDTWNSGKLSYNYKTGEFYAATYPVEFTRGVCFKQNLDALDKVATSSTTLVYENNTGTDDNGTAITRTYDVDWSGYGIAGEKYLTGVWVTCKRNSGSRLKISVAKDFDPGFFSEKTFDLRGKNVSDDFVRIYYRLPGSLWGQKFKIRLTLLDGSTPIEVLAIQPELVPSQENPVQSNYRNPKAQSA